jgi:hypothetical protein
MTTNINDLLRGGQCDLPKEVDICPECGSELEIDCYEWDSVTGFPTRSGFNLDCKQEEKDLDDWTHNDDDTRSSREVMHRHWQSDWQPVIDKVWGWIQQQREAAH